MNRIASSLFVPLIGSSFGLWGCTASATGHADEPPALSPHDDAAKPSGARHDASPRAAQDAPAAADAPAADATRDAGAVTADASASSADTSTRPWWDGAWTRRSRLVVSDPALTEELVDFQIPVRLDAETIDYAATQAGGNDVRFVLGEGAGAEVLAHEVDEWNPTGASWLWVKLPKHGKPPTALWLYYGNPNAPAPSRPQTAAVWPAPYAGVWHLGGAVKDSTAGGVDVKEMVGGSFVASRLGKGLSLDASKREHVRLEEDVKIVAGATGVTFSAFIRPAKLDPAPDGMIIMTLGKWFRTNHNSYADFNVNGAGQMLSHVDPGASTSGGSYARFKSNTGIVKTAEWVWLTYEIDLVKEEERFYKNGELVDTKKSESNKLNASVFIDMPSSRVVLGTEEDAADGYFDGVMDELRIEKTLRPAAWLAAQHRALTIGGYVTVEKSD